MTTVFGACPCCGYIENRVAPGQPAPDLLAAAPGSPAADDGVACDWDENGYCRCKPDLLAALWECGVQSGMDTDGDTGPDAMVAGMGEAGFAAAMVEQVRQLRRDYEASLAPAPDLLAAAREHGLCSCGDFGGPRPLGNGQEYHYVGCDYDPALRAAIEEADRG